MSRKHFILLAAALRVHRAALSDQPESIVWECDNLISNVACVCNSVNPNFSFDRFYTAANHKGCDDAE